MRIKNCVSGCAGLILAAALVMTACGDAEGGPGGGGGYIPPHAITGFTVTGAETSIDTAKRTVDVVVPWDIGTSFTPDISVSGVSVDPPSGFNQTLGLPPQDYLYTVTAADGSQAEWTVIVRWEPLTSLAEVGTHLSSATQAGTPTDPIPLPLAINLSSGGWAGLLSALDKYVALDLTGCTMDGMSPTPGEFDPDYTNSTGKDKIVTLTLPKAATSIKDGTGSNPTFRYFTALTELRAPAVETIGHRAFQACTKLATVSLPAATTIGYSAVAHCDALETVSLPAATTIGGYAFAQCHELTSVSLPAARTIGGEGVFWGCTALETVSLPAATSIGDYAFYDCYALEMISLPATLTSIGRSPFAACRALTDISVASGNPAYKAEDGKLLTKNGATLIGWPAATGDVTVGAPLTAIGDYAFWGCITLETVSLPAATTIGGYAFYKCDALKTVSLPAAASIRVGAFAFTGTGDLLIILGSATNLTPPTLEVSMFSSVTVKTVTVKVPSGATGYAASLPITYTGTDTTDSWGNGFRGGGWNGTMGGGMVNTNISLTVTH